MSVTVNGRTNPSRSGPGDKPKQRAAAVAEHSRVVAPPKLRRRPLLLVASVAAVCLGALLAVWAYTSTSTAQEVVAVRSSVPRGTQITREDLVSVRVGVDPALKPIPAAQLESVVGQRAGMDLAAGGLVTPDEIAPAVLPPQGMSVVGVAVPAALLPGEPLRVGDRVRVVATPGDQGEVTGGKQRAIPAVVVGLYPDADQGRTVVSVQVPFELAAELAARSATGKVAVVLDSRER
jgi:hypothetical protein